MTITVVERWKNPDSTLDLNNRLKYLVEKGFVWDGTVAPTGIGLSITINPFAAYTQDGMLALSDAIETYPVVAGQVNVVVLLAKYNTGGTPTVPVVNIQVLEVSVFNAHPDKAYMLEFCRINLPPAAVNVTAADIDFTQRDEVDTVGRESFRGITTFALLPVPTSPTNRVGDHYWVSDHKVFYFWDGSSWEAINTGSFNAEATLFNDQLAARQRNRLDNGSGVVAGTRPGDGSFAALPEITLISTPAVPNSISLDAFSAIINGHFVETYARSYTLAAPSDRFDLIFLEIWREETTTPDSLLYDLNPDGTLNENIEGIDDIEETLQWVAGPAGKNYDFYKLESYDHKWLVVKARFSHITNVPVTAIYDPVDASVANLATNIDGVAFTVPAGSDDRIWVGTSATTPFDGKSWAIPLFVFKRLSTETPVDSIRVFRNGVRHVFPVYPVTDLSISAKGAIAEIEKREPTSPLTQGRLAYDLPSRMVTGVDHPVQAGIAPNTVKFYDDKFKVRFRGFEDWVEFSSDEFTLPTPPILGWERILVFLKCQVTLSADDPATKSNYSLSTHRPFLPSTIAGTIRGMGYRQGYIGYDLVVENLGAVDVLDSNDAMAASTYGWSHEDLANPVSVRYEDGGLWSRPVPVADFANPHGNPYGVEWAIPICLIHRRNQTAYNRDTNQNGTGASRPDDRQDPFTLHPDDLVDLRHKLELSEEDADAYVEQNLDLLHKGQLRTRLANKYLGGGGSGAVAGSRILQADIIGTTTGGTWPLPASDTARTIWSDGREYQICSVSFNITAGVPISELLYDYTYTGGSNDGEITIKAPPGAFLIRHLPGFLYTPGDPTNLQFLEFLGPPCWSTQWWRSPIPFYGPLGFEPLPSKSKYIDTSNVDQALTYWMPGAPGTGAGASDPFKVITTDNLGRAIAMRGNINTTGKTGTVTLSWWVCYDRSFATIDNYDDNHGLAEVPDVVWRATLDPGGSNIPVNVGALQVEIKKSYVAASSVTISDTDITAATGLPGTVRLLGLNFAELIWSPVRPTVSSITLEDVNQSDITINFAGVWSGTLTAVVYFSTSVVDSWIEVGRAAKSVQALYRWYESTTIDLTAIPPIEYALNLGTQSWVPHQLGNHLSGSSPIFWSRPATTAGTRWVLSYPETVGFAYSNILSFDCIWFDRYVKVVAPSLKPLGSALTDRLVIEYTYTPYQGISTPSGQTPNVVTALPMLKEMLHGKVEAVSPWYASQSGPASFFSGIETYRGTPINNHHPLHDVWTVSPLSRFKEYNMTSLVNPQNQPPTDLALSNNAGSLFRLPYPQNLAMVASNYHKGPMEFDFDPARAGASAGELSYAPGYWGGACTEPDYLKYNQFDNGLSPLVCNNDLKNSNDNIILPASEYNTFGTTVASLNFDGRRYNFTQAGGDSLRLYASIRTNSDSILKRVQHHMKVEREPGVSANVGLFLDSLKTRDFLPVTTHTLHSGWWLIDRQGTSQFPTYVDGFALGILKEVIMSIHPGLVYSYRMHSEGPNALAGVLINRLVPNAANEGHIYHTAVLAEKSSFGDLGSKSFSPDLALYTASSYTDILKLPWSSYTVETMYVPVSPSPGGNSYSSGLQSLKGLTIGYPTSWVAGDVTSLDALFVGSQDSYNRGRGIYLGSSTQRAIMPVLLPGSGNPLRHLASWFKLNLSVGIDESVPTFPFSPGVPLFADDNKVYLEYSHGGKLAVVYFGLFVNPSGTEYRNQTVLQISCSPVGSDRLLTNAVAGSNSPYFVDGTAIDAFWPLGRPLVRSTK